MEVGGRRISRLLLCNKSPPSLFVNIYYLSWSLWTTHLRMAPWGSSDLEFLRLKCRPEGLISDKRSTHVAAMLVLASVLLHRLLESPHSMVAGSPRESGPREGDPGQGWPPRDLPSEGAHHRFCHLLLIRSKTS